MAKTKSGARCRAAATGGRRAPESLCRLALGLVLMTSSIALDAVAVVAPQELPLEQLVRRVQDKHRGFQDWRARFRQRVIQRPGAPATVKEGDWMMRTPGRMRIQYDDPPRLFVADGEAMYWYLPGDNQVQVLPQESLDPKSTPTLYLSGAGDLREDFLISGTSWGEPLAPGNIQIRLDPLSQGSRFTHLLLEVDPVTANVARLVWFGLLGEASDIQYYDVETDVGLAEDLFQFTIPPNAQVEYLGSRP